MLREVRVHKHWDRRESFNEFSAFSIYAKLLLLSVGVARGSTGRDAMEVLPATKGMHFL